MTSEEVGPTLIASSLKFLTDYYFLLLQEIKKLQDHVWSVGIIKWGDDKYGVMNFLQAEWEKSVCTRAVDYNQRNVSETARTVLEVSKTLAH